ncbi:MAG: DUF993 family protein [Planctomycetes bacterium]|nr:DUF993 family protein [Planctomycetota bacterium]
MRVVVEGPRGPYELSDEVLAPYLDAVGDEPPVPAQRLVFAAAHLVMRAEYADVPHSLAAPGASAELARWIDWDATMALRVELDRLGFGIAEAMDTAQRFDIGWETAAELIRRTGALGLVHDFVAGAGIDHLGPAPSEDALVEGVAHQARVIQDAGGIPVLLPLLPLARAKAREDDYVRVYRAIVERCDGPLFVHWLGEMFLPELAGYFPGRAFERVMELDPAKVRGAKLSLLDADLERRLRAELVERDQLMLTGDDFHFAELLWGGPPRRTTRLGAREVPLGDFSHGLLGIFDAIAEPASLALEFLARGDEPSYRALMEPCEALSRHLFQAPTRHYKAGLACLAWLNGLQPNPLLAQHEERARDLAHYHEAARLASAAGVLRDAGLAAERLAELARQAAE